MATQTELAWAAGIVDGEGCIRVSRNYHNQNKQNSYTAQIKVKMASHAAILEMHRISGVGSVSWTPGWKGRYKMWIWKASARQIQTFLPLIRPFLVVKADQADLLMKFIAMPRTTGNRWRGRDAAYLAARDEMYEQCKALKHLA